MPVAVVSGLQWGDEGKGKIIDLLSAKADVIVRCQGGNNAGHTVMAQNKEYYFHVIPSGILFPHTKCFIGGGVIIEPKAFLRELETLKREGISFEKRLKISPFAHVIFPYHMMLDQLSEKRKGAEAIGTTGRGIGPCFIDRSGRMGIRMADLIHPDSLRLRLEEILPQKNEQLSYYEVDPLALDQIHSEYCEYGKQLAPLVDHVEDMLATQVEQGKKILLEGAQGALLDVLYGTYPFVTSCNTISSGIAMGAGIGPSQVDSVLGVLKAYNTRVGNGPFPTEFSEEEEILFLGNNADLREHGTTTGRKRRLGWFDALAARFTVRLNGVDHLVITKLDILDKLENIKICVAYSIDGEKTTHFPANIDQLKKAVPIYEEMPGWKTSTKHLSSFEQLPQNAKLYLERLSKLCHCPLGIVSVGPDRKETLILSDVFEPE